MDLRENINESFDLEFQEIGETGGKEFQIKDIENNITWRFYEDDIKKLDAFLNRLKEFKLI